MAKMVKHSPRTKSLIDEAGDMVTSKGSDRLMFPANSKVADKAPNEKSDAKKEPEERKSENKKPEEKE